MSVISKLFIGNRILCGPLEIVFLLLVFILSKNTGLTPFQLTLIACIKPISSFFAFYVSSIIFEHPQRIRSYLLINNIVGSLPCFLYPFVEDVWFYIGSYIVFMITTRASYPAWIEVLKSNLDASRLTQTVSYGNSVYYFANIVLSPLICFFMDQDANLWRYLFLSFGALKLMNIFIVPLIELNREVSQVNPSLEPLKKAWGVLKENPPFAHYLVLYFLGGAGIIGSQVILPTYFKEYLHLSYSQLGIAFSFCKGVSFILTSPYWANFTSRLSLYHINCIVNLFSILYFVLIIAATGNTSWLYLGYIFYGTMQAGSELSWSLSGPFFSGSKNSTIYSSLNLAMVGIRGCICPFLGGLLFAYSGPVIVFTTSILTCLIGIVYGLMIDRRYEVPFGYKKNNLEYI